MISIKKKIERINIKINALNEEIKTTQESCPHADLEYKYGGSSGNYDRSQDDYWLDWKCNDCGKRWTTSQENPWHQTKIQHPQSKRVLKFT